MQRNVRKISVHSFDFDDCIFNSAYRQNRGKKNSIIHGNSLLLDQIAQECQDQGFSDVLLMIGSLRQSISLDESNTSRNNTSSCFSALYSLKKELSKRLMGKSRCSIVPTLLSDLFKEELEGTNFLRGLRLSKNYPYLPESEIPYNFYPDDSKLTTLYVQMHRIANRNRNAEITFNFYDDRADIIEGLYNFFEQNPNLMPKNIKLKLHQYNGNVHMTNPEIQGKGEIDENYSKNIALMHDCAGLNYKDYVNDKDSDKAEGPEDSKCIRIVNLLKNESLARFKQERKTTVNLSIHHELSADAKQKIKTAIASYIANRAHFEDETKPLPKSYVGIRTENQPPTPRMLVLDWLSRHVRNSELTKQKILLADNFYNLVKKENSVEKLLLELKKYKENHLLLEINNHKWDYTFTQSDLRRTFIEIEGILNYDKNTQHVRLASQSPALGSN